MTALLIVCGLGFISLLSEILNFKKVLHAVVTAGLIAAALTVAGDWGDTALYFNNMLIFDQFAIAFSCLIMAVAAASLYCSAFGDIAPNRSHCPCCLYHCWRDIDGILSQHGNLIPGY